MTCLLVLSTAASKREALKISQSILNKRLAACVNISGPVQSLYWWRGKQARSKEVLLFIKTRASLFAKLQKAIREKHSYQVPEIVAFRISKGSRAYLSWILSQTRPV